MPIPRTREDTVSLVATTFEKLMAELGTADIGSFPCVDDWTVKDLLAVRGWWTRSVADWIEAGARGEKLDLPAKGYRWNETPRLNADIVKRARAVSYRRTLSDLRRGYDRVMKLIDELDDHELLQPGVFVWAGKWPVARWISINTARQYTTARTFIRRAIRKQRR